MLLLAEHIKESRPHYRLCLHRNHFFLHSDEAEPLWELLLKPIAQKYDGRDGTDSSYILTFYRAGFIQVFQRWVDSVCQEPPQEIISILLDDLARKNIL